jgi:hypothetical protein
VDIFLENHFNQICAKLGVQVPLDGKEIDPRLRPWLNSVSHAKVESRSFKYAAYAFFEALARDDQAQKARLGSYLLGEPITAKQTGAFNVNEKMDKSNAFRMLRSMCQLLHELGHSGTVLLFDEGDRMVSIGSSKQEKIACDNLREVIDRCADDKLPGTMFVYAVPPPFINNIAPKYPALSQRVGKLTSVFSRKNPLSPIINLQDLDLPGLELLRQIGRRLSKIFEIAYSPGFDSTRQLRNIDLIAEQCAALLSDHHRREFVKTLINFFNEQQAEGERDYDQDRIVSELRKVHGQMGGQEGEGTSGQRSREY